MHRLYSFSRIVIFGFFFVGLAAGCGAKDEQTGEAEAAPAPTGPAVVLEGGRLTIDGKPVALPGRVADWEAVLGKASRRETFAAEGPAAPIALAPVAQAPIALHIWDTKGILAYEQPGKGTVTKVAFVFDPNRATSGEVRLAPQSPFAGTLTLEQVPLSALSSPGQINERLKVGPLRQLPKFPFSWNMGYGPWTLTAITTSRGDGLVEVLVGE